jgi:hypothetical protein
MEMAKMTLLLKLFIGKSLGVVYDYGGENVAAVRQRCTIMAGFNGAYKLRDVNMMARSPILTVYFSNQKNFR